METITHTPTPVTASLLIMVLEPPTPKKVPWYIAPGIKENVINTMENNTASGQKPPLPRKPTLRKTICEAFFIPEDVLFIRSRKREIVNARQFYMYVINELLKAGPSETARHVGYDKNLHSGWDHATVLHACKAINNLRDTNKIFRDTTNRIITMIFQDQIEMPNVFEKIT